MVYYRSIIYSIVFILRIFVEWNVSCHQIPISCEYCNPNWTPYKNMVSGLVGYNILKGDPIAYPDPGFGQQLFLPTSKTGENTYVLNDGITAKDLETCQTTMTKTSFTTTTGFRNFLESSSTIGSDLQVGVDVEVEKGKAKATIPPVFTRSWGESKRYKDLKKMFTKERKMVTAIRGVCLMYDLKLSTILLPPFTPQFIKGLKLLYKAKDFSKSRQIIIFRQFINEFGTHYMKEAQLGAQYIYQTIYSSKVRNTFSLNTLQDCSYINGAKVFGIQVENNKSTCTDTEKQKLKSMGSENIQSKRFTKGSRPIDIKKWAVSDFTPVPLKFKLSPIVNLFTENNIDQNFREQGNLTVDGEVIKSIEIRKWFLPLYKDFCNTMGMSCEKSHGCGIDDTCPIDAVCTSNTGKQSCTEWSSWECSCWNGLKQRRSRTCTGCKGTKQVRDSNGRCYNYNERCMFELSGIFDTSYGKIELCPNGQWAVGFKTKVESSQGAGIKYDDTAMNAIGLLCGNHNTKPSEGNVITSSKGPWGSWKKYWATCTDGFTAAMLRVEEKLKPSYHWWYGIVFPDNTATNSIRLRCNSGKWFEAVNGAGLGKWHPAKECRKGTKIIGIQTMVQPEQGSSWDEGDDTALNSVRFFCG